MPRGSAPGERRGGRKKGTLNRRTQLFESMVGTVARAPLDGDSIDFLTSIYRDPEMPLTVRIDCAKVVAPFDRPRLTSITNRDGQDVAQPIMAPAELREWARNEVRIAFGLPQLTIDHRDDGCPGSIQENTKKTIG